MGLFGSDDDQPQPSEADQLASEQLQENQAELEYKKNNLYQTRLDIIKGQGAQTWVPNRNQQAPTPPSSFTRF
jgi:hypothetical protein